MDLDDSKQIKTLAYNYIENDEETAVLFGYISNEKPQLMLAFSKSLTEKGLNAGVIIKELAREINGGGGGQNFFATAGGSKVEGLKPALEALTKFI